MKRILLAIIVIFALIIPSGVALAEREEPLSEIQFILDFYWGHEVVLYLSPDVDTDHIIDVVLDLAGEGATLDYLYKGEEEQIIYVSAQNLISEKGRSKTFSRDLSNFSQFVKKMDLDIKASLVMQRTHGVFSYTVDPVDLNQQPLTLAGNDEWEVWWEIPMEIKPGFQATLNLDLNLSWSAFAGLYILLAWFAVLAVWHKRNCSIWKSRWLLIGHWIVSVAVLVSLMVAGWPDIFEYLYLDPEAGSTPFTVVLVLLLLGFVILTIYMKHRASNKKISIKEDLPRYSLSLIYILLMAVLIALALIVWPVLAELSPWLALVIYLLGGALLPGQILLLVFRLLGTRELYDSETSRFSEDLAGKLNVKVDKILIIPEKRWKTAFAGAISTHPPKIVITEYLWNNLDSNEKCFILAHELAHVRMGFRFHVWTNIMISWIITLGIMLPAWLSVYPHYSLVGGFVTAGLIQSLIIQPQLRRIELKADNLALSISKNPGAAVSALKKLEDLNSHYNVNNRTTHPTMKERFTAIEHINNHSF